MFGSLHLKDSSQSNRDSLPSMLEAPNSLDSTINYNSIERQLAIQQFI